jgi:hypothetical protein
MGADTGTRRHGLASGRWGAWAIGRQTRRHGDTEKYAVIARSVEGGESDVAISGKSLFTTKDAKLSKVRKEFFTDDR